MIRFGRKHSLSPLLPALLPLAAFLWLLACYAPGLRETFFVIDDASLISLPQLRAPFSLHLLHTWLTPGTHLDFYPLRDASYWLDIHLLGADSSGAEGFVFRMVNFAWVLACALGILTLLRQLGARLAPAALASAAWLVLPLHSEMLMWPSARKDCMALALGLASACCYVRSLRSRQWAGAWGALAVIAFAASLLSKSTFALAPWAIPAVALSTRDREAWKPRQIAVWGSAAALGAALSIVQSQVYTRLTDMRFLYSPAYRLEGALAAFGRMWAGLVLPGLAAVDVENWGDWPRLNAGYVPLGALLLLGLAAATAWAFERRRKDAALVLALAWLSYLPVSTALFPHRNFYSVRYFEPILLGFWVWAAWLAIARFQAGSSGRRLIGALGVAVLLAGAGASLREARAWDDGLRPFLKAIEASDEGASNPSLVRFAYNVLADKNRWGRLDAAGLAQEREFRERLVSECGPGAEPGDLRNSHLCLGFWLDDLTRRQPILPRELDAARALRAVESVNPSSLERLKRKLALQERLTRPEGAAGPTSEAVAPERPATTPMLRLERWLSTCIDGDGPGARAMIARWRSEHLLDTPPIADFLTDIRAKYPKSAQRARACLPSS